jgi:hypothetical protein
LLEMDTAKKLTKLDEAKQHVLFHHRDADGYIAVAQKQADGTFWQRHYKPNELAAVLSERLGEDVYFSQNTFYKPYRRLEHVRQLRALYVDVDCYLLNYDPQWTLDKLRLEIFDERTPQPNLVIFSGRGLVCIWTIEPVPYKALPLWQAIQNYLQQQLSYVGGDSKALDPSRIFRVAGSINSKSSEIVHVEYLHNHCYSLRDIQSEYLPELPSENEQTQQRKGRAKKVVQLYNIYRLYHARLLDLTKIIELRRYDVKGLREVVCFLYRYWSCCYNQDTQKALEDTLQLNSLFTKPLTENEVIKATISAEKAFKAKSDKKAQEIAKAAGYKGAGYNYSNAKLIELLDITDKEQQQLQTIIGANEKRRRHRERNKLRNRELRQSVERSEYLEQQKEQTEDKLFLLRKAIESYPNATQKELAGKLGVDRSYISKLRKKLNV